MIDAEGRVLQLELLAAGLAMISETLPPEIEAGVWLRGEADARKRLLKLKNENNITITVATHDEVILMTPGWL